jgi:hypothetical protein
VKDEMSADAVPEPTKAGGDSTDATVWYGSFPTATFQTIGCCAALKCVNVPVTVVQEIVTLSSWFADA